MEIYILNQDFEKESILDNPISIIWTDRYDEAGDFEIVVPASKHALDTFKQDYYILREESEHVMIIESCEVSVSSEEGESLIVRGRSLESILDRRIIWSQTIISGNLQDSIADLIDYNVINPSVITRTISNFTFEYSTDTAVTDISIDASQFTGDNLYDVIVSLCKTYNLGFKITLNDDDQFVFKLYSGKNRTYEQADNPYVIFSPQFDNLSGSNFLTSKNTLKTVTLVAGEGEGTDRKVATVDHGETGIKRRELYTDARDISSTVDDRTLTDDEYYTLLRQRGTEKLSEWVITKAFEGEVQPDITFNYGRDFFIGDIVEIENEYGIKSAARVAEFIFSQDVEGTKNYPTFILIEDEEVPDNGSILAENGSRLTSEISENLVIESAPSTSYSVKISELPGASDINDATIIPGVQNGRTERFTFSMLKNKIVSLIHGIPSGGSAGQVLTKASSVDYNATWQNVPTELPTGGSNGQVLTKTSSGNAWQNVPTELPTTGTTGQVLTKTASGSQWSDAPSGIPSGGTTGQVLTKNSNTDQDVKWADPQGGGGGSLPPGGSIGQVLTKLSGADDDADWTDIPEHHIETTNADYQAHKAAYDASDNVFFIPDGETDPVNASDISYSNTGSKLQASTVQQAIDTLALGDNSSYTDTRIGTWLDGKPLYRRFWNYGVLPSSATAYKNHGIANVKHIHINMGESFFVSKNTGYISNTWSYNPPYAGYVNLIGVNQTQVVVGSSTTSAANYDLICCFEYTKTTD